MKKFIPLLLTFLSLQVFANNVPYKIRLVEQNSKTPIADAYVRVLDLTDGKRIVAVSNDSGFIALQLKVDNKYRVDISKQTAEEGVKYITYSYFLSGVEILRPTFSEVSLEKVKVNSQVRLSNIYFATGSVDLNGMDKVALSNTLIALKNSPSLTVEIGVHAACNEPESISAKRMETIKEYFANKGELAERVVIKNYGKGKQIGGCDCNSPMIYPDDVYSMNRVAEFKVLNF